MSKKQIEEILEKIGIRYGMDVDGISYIVNAHKLAPYLQPKLSKDTVVITKEKYDILMKDYEDYQDLLKNFDNYLFEYRKFADNRIKETTKETTEKAFKIVKNIIDKKYALETPSTRVTLSNIVNQIEEQFIKQLFNINLVEGKDE